MKFLCIDGNSVLNRAFYGIKLLTTADGRYTNAVYGFMNIFLKLLAEHKPDEVAAAFDVRAKTFRHKMYDKYKANRKGMPEELAQQLPVLQQLLRELGYNVVTCDGYEADDLLGTFSAACERNGEQCLIATGDRDSLQLVSDKTTVLLTATQYGRGAVTVMDSAAVYEKYGVKPQQLIDVKALMGDASDNIPGVAGVGEKTALALISRFGSLDAVYENIESSDIKPGVREKLLADRDMAYMSQKLARIDRAAPVDTDPASYVRGAGNPQKAAEILSSLEMHSMVSRLGLDAAAAPQEAEPIDEVFVQPLKAQHIKDAERLFLADSEDGLYAGDGKRVFSVSDDMFSELAKSGVALVCANGKEIFARCLREDLPRPNVSFDLMLAAYLLNPLSTDYSTARLAAEYGARARYVCGDCPELPKLPSLYEILKERIEGCNMTSLLADIEIPLSRVLAKMELRGFLVDAAAIREFGEMLEKRIASERDEVWRLCGHEFNLNSSKQMGEALFDGLKLPVYKKNKTGYSTDAETLEKLRGSHPVIQHILNYRAYDKLQSTYVSGLLAAADRENRIHTEFSQTETRTGRISSSRPNLQNIPVRTELGSNFRRFFIADRGCVLLDADYSQIELRVLAHLSGDKTMTEAFNSGEDIHTSTASRIFGVAPEQVTPLMRRRAKAVNFGIVYGIGAYSLSNDIGVSVSEADKYIKDYLANFSGVDAYLKRTVDKAAQDGYVTTMYGRRRALPELANSNRNIQSLGRRLAMNTPIQGSAADIIKIAMVRVDECLEREGLDAYLMLQIHDELIVQSAEGCADRAAAILKQEMEKAASLSARLEVNVNRGASWYDAK